MKAPPICEACLIAIRRANVDMLMFGTGGYIPACTDLDGKHEHARYVPLRDIRIVPPPKEKE